jgi:hypothetical protein
MYDGPTTSRYAAVYQDEVRNVRVKVAAVRCGGLCLFEAAEADLLDPRVGRLVLRVKSVGSGGRLVLEGRDKKTVRDHVENCASCHLRNLDVWQNPRLVRGDVDHSC